MIEHTLADSQQIISKRTTLDKFAETLTALATDYHIDYWSCNHIGERPPDKQLYHCIAAVRKKETRLHIH